MDETKRRAWRPRSPEGTGKPSAIRFSCTWTLYARISAVAAAQGLTIADFAKMSAAAAVTKYEEEVLRRTAG